MRKLFSQTELDDQGMSSALFAMASLMMLLLPTLLLSTSTQKFTTLPLSIASSAEELPDRPGSPIKKIVLSASEDGFSVQAWVRTTDVRSKDLEEKTWNVENTAELYQALAQLKQIARLLAPAQARPFFRHIASASTSNLSSSSCLSQPLHRITCMARASPEAAERPARLHDTQLRQAPGAKARSNI